ncbi:MAG: hypothetical protein U0Q16_23470 [Bryobacteraceae bacterium]
MMRRRDFCLLPAAALAQQPATASNLVLLTLDGLRWQEVFTGIDPRLMLERSTQMHEQRALRDRLWRESPTERREALMPYFWKTFAPQAVVREDVRVTNAFRVSYPGYSEILTGRAQDDVIRGNDPKQNPTETFLEFLRRKYGVAKELIAVFASWDAFRWISESKPGSLFINAAYEEAEPTPRVAELSRLQRQLLTEDDGARHDWITFEMAIDYLRNVRPRALYIAFNETDEWAHQRRYDRVLMMVAYVDRCIQTLWGLIQSTPGYRDQTTLVITCDHGRGGTLADWSDHGSRVEGADRIWLAAAGPAKREFEGVRTQAEIAPAILRSLGIDPAEYASRFASK